MSHPRVFFFSCFFFLNPFHVTLHGILHYDGIQHRTVTKWILNLFILKLKNMLTSLLNDHFSRKPYISVLLNVYITNNIFLEMLLHCCRYWYQNGILSYNIMKIGKRCAFIVIKKAGYVFHKGLVPLLKFEDFSKIKRIMFGESGGRISLYYPI